MLLLHLLDLCTRQRSLDIYLVRACVRKRLLAGSSLPT